jgi:hypothetical protein
MNFPFNETEEDWSASSGSVLTSSSEETDDSDWSDALEEIKIELSTEEMSVSSKGTVGWLQKHNILKSKRKHAEAKGMSAGDKKTAKGKPKGKQTVKSESIIEGKVVSTDGKERVKAKLKRKNSSNRSLSSNIKVDNRAEDPENTVKKTRSLSTFFSRGATHTVARNARYSSDVEYEDAYDKEREDDRSTTSSSVSSSSLEEDSYSSDDLEEVKIELSTEEMSTSSKGTVGWFQKNQILKSKRKHVETKGISARNKENAKDNPSRKHASRSYSSNRSWSSIIKPGHKAKDHQYTAKTRKTKGGAAATVEPNERFSSGVQHVDSNCTERQPQNGRFKAVSEQMYRCRLSRNDLSIRLSPLLIFCRSRRTTAGDVIMLPVVCAAAAES